MGEVSRLLEEREKMQGRLAEAEETAARLTHDQAILLEEVQSQQERVTSLTTERDALQAEMEDTEVGRERWGLGGWGGGGEMAARLTHDQAILLEEVQSQQERVTSLTTERDALQAEVEDTEVGRERWGLEGGGERWCPG